MSAVLHYLLLLESIFNEWAIKNDPVNKATPFFVFYEGDSTASQPSLGTRIQKFSLQSSQ